MTLRFLVPAFMIFLASSCKQPDAGANLTIKEENAIIEDVSTMLHNYNADIRRNGLNAEFKYLDSTADFFWVPPGARSFINYDSVASVLKQNQNIFKTVDNKWLSLWIRPLNRKLATYSGRIHSTLTDSTGKTLDITLLETGVVRKNKNGWKLLSGQTSVMNVR